VSDRNPLPDLSDDQAAEVDQGIERFGEFMRDVLQQPKIVNDIPDGSTLSLHRLNLPQYSQPVRLTAFRPKHAERWSVRVTGFGDQEPAPEYPRAMPDWIVSIIPLMQNATWESPNDAFAAIEEALQRASELHLLAG
jgi:hypothetical protein